MLNSFKILMSFYNAEPFIERAIMSVLTQKYEGDFKIILVNDASTDGSHEKIVEIMKDDNNDRIIYIKNEVRLTALENLHNSIMNHCQPNEIALIVDGDDALLHKSALDHINNFYNENDCWVSWGSSQWSDNHPCISRPLESREVFNNLRNEPFHVSHIRSFRAGLYHKIKEQDAEFSCHKDKNGNWYKATYDVSMFHPLLECAGYDHCKYNHEKLYWYNRHNPISDDKVRLNEQISIHMEINQKPKFKQIKSYL